MKSFFISLFVVLATLQLTAQTASQTVTVPSMISSPQARAQYLATHYWDKFNFKNTAVIDSDNTEQMFSNFLAILNATTQQTAAKSITALMDKASATKSAYERFSSLAELYLYDPNSPMRNDEYFIPVLKHMIASPHTDKLLKSRYGSLLTIAGKNRTGTKAADFTYTTAAGKQSHMYSISADYLLLYFYNPDCNNCKEVSAWLKSNPQFTKQMRNGRIRVLAVYPDKELSLWRKHLSEIPAQWICGYDKGTIINDNDIYDLKAIPCLYLLDKDKKVILKDTSTEMLGLWMADNLH